MAFHFQLQDGLLDMAISGKITLQDLRQVMVTLTDVESRLPITPDRILDISKADFSTLPSADLAATAEVRRVTKLKNPVKSAIIAAQPEQFGLARMFMGRNQNPDITLMIFKDAPSAYQWLGRPAPH